MNALEGDPSAGPLARAEVAYNLGLMLEAQDRHADAVAALRRAVELNQALELATAKLESLNDQANGA